MTVQKIIIHDKHAFFVVGQLQNYFSGDEKFKKKYLGNLVQIFFIFRKISKIHAGFKLQFNLVSDGIEKI